MSTSGWSLPARAKTRGLGLPPALSQLAPSFRARGGEKYFSSRVSLPKIRAPSSSRVYLNIG